MRLGKSGAIRRSANPEKGDFGISATFRKSDFRGLGDPYRVYSRHRDSGAADETTHVVVHSTWNYFLGGDGWESDRAKT